MFPRAVEQGGELFPGNSVSWGGRNRSLRLLMSQQPGLGDRVIAALNIMTNLLQPSITCFKTHQNLEIDFHRLPLSRVFFKIR